MGKKAATWLEALQNQKFFLTCSYHKSVKKNVCCLDCCISICAHCVPAHRSHRLLQIRRYVYNDVVQLEDLQRLVDCSNVQAYTINGAKVVFIKKRPQNRQFKGSGNYCTSCDRTLQHPFIHCSLACKVEFVMKHYKDLSLFVKKCKTLTLGPDFLIPQDIMRDENDDMTTTNHSTIMDYDEPVSWLSGSHSSSSSSSYLLGCTNNMVAACSNKVVRKKRSGLVYVWLTNIYDDHDHNSSTVSDEDMATSMSRRKGVPQRSPMC